MKIGDGDLVNSRNFNWKQYFLHENIHWRLQTDLKYHIVEVFLVHVGLQITFTDNIEVDMEVGTEI